MLSKTTVNCYARHGHLNSAAVVALGEHTSAIMTKDAKLQQRLIELGELTGDLTWPLPLWDEYKEHIKSDRADIANIDPTFSRTGGAIEGGTFLAHFVKKTPWAHIDIAPRMSAVKNDNLAKGATGEPVRLLVRVREDLLIGMTIEETRDRILNDDEFVTQEINN